MNSPKSIFTAPPKRPFPKRHHSDSSHNALSISKFRDSLDEDPSLNRQVEAITVTSPLSGPRKSRQQPDLNLTVLTSAPDVEPLPEPLLSTPAAPVAPPTPTSIGAKRNIRNTSAHTWHTKNEPSRKRLRRNFHTAQILASLSSGPAQNEPAPPASPLFFSNSPRQRPKLPPRFSSSEAAAKMLSKTKGEDTGIKTVTLARGTITTSTSPDGRSHLRTRNSGSVDRTSFSRTETPESQDKVEQMRALYHIGIVELLELDERPSFLVDLSEPANAPGGPLNVLFCNTAFRNECPRLYECLVATEYPNQTSTPDISPHLLAQFKNWVIGGTPADGTVSPYFPSTSGFSFGWTFSTLQKRMRFVRASFSINPSNSQSPAPFTKRTSQSKSFTTPANSHVPQSEPTDYFGAMDTSSLSPHPPPANHTPEIISTIETPETPSRRINYVSRNVLDQTSYSSTSGSGSGSGSGKFSSGDECQLVAAAAGNADAFGVTASANQGKEIGFFDWTRLTNFASLPPHIQFARSVDWENTALGPIEGWSPDLRQMCNLIMASPHPAAMYWGEDLIAIYNEAYIMLAGQKHPQLMGQSYREAWTEIWDEVKDVFEGAQTTGQATMKDDDCLFIKRGSFLEETYFSWSIIPMVGRDGTVMGLYNPAFEKTRRKIAERRMLTLREVGERTATARDLKGFWSQVLGALECNEYDTPFVILYSLSDEHDSEEGSSYSSSVSSSKQCNLEGALGVPSQHRAAPDVVDLKTSNEGFVPYFREAMKTNKPLVIDLELDNFPADLLNGLDWRGFGDPAKSVVICPIHPTTGDSTLGFLVMGINPRRPFDDDYNLFVQLLSRQLATSLASVVLFEEEIKRGQRAAKLAALDRIELSEQLAARTQEAIESELKFTRMAEFAPVGMFIADASGRITYCNDTWYEISRIPKETESTELWMDYIHEKDQELVERVWETLIQDPKPLNTEFRFKAAWMDRNGIQGDTWVLLSAYPETYAGGALKSVFGSITNISQQKWAEGFQKRKTEEAVELKKQQERFIDLTSHEMRNPLSAILQCADEIVNTLTEARATAAPGSDLSIFDGNIDAAQTISVCAQHQKRIVDDVLTLSKLDSAMLMVTPVDAQPVAVVQRALKMFEGEMRNADIQMKFIVEQSLTDLEVDWVRFDPSRVFQVLINLITNAIKFTTLEAKRTIAVHLSASKTKPSAHEEYINYLSPRSKDGGRTTSSDWGRGEVIYVQFAVKDTGRGLTSKEMAQLFQRFHQASPRTHVQYGGSGLGLFISRELTELQGGEIGVASEAGKGSIFAFFVKARRSATPKTSRDQTQTLVMPRAVPEHRTADAGPPPPRTRDFAVTDNHESSGQPINILVVEDNIVNQRVLVKQLKNAGNVVHVANHGGEALDVLKESTYWINHNPSALRIDVVLMDQEMPVMDGLTCTKEIRKLELAGTLLSHVPIIAVTANARAQQIETAIEAGMDDVVSKPFRIPELMPKINELMTRYNEANG